MTNTRTVVLILATLASVGSIVYGQASSTKLPAPLPTAETAIGPWDVAIVRRAEEILASPTQWNRAATNKCPADAKTFSIYCALQKAVDEATGQRSDPGRATAGPNPQPARSDCLLSPAEDRWKGSCGSLLDEVPVFTIERVKAVTSGIWRTDVHPTEVWAGTMTDAENPVFDEAAAIIDLVAPKKYPSARLKEYNNDSMTTFSDVQSFFHLLQDRLAKKTTSELNSSVDRVELEIYAGGTGVIRTYAGWFPVSGFSLQDSTLRFQIDTAKQVPPSGLDREILQRADTIIASNAVWNRADNRKCNAAATTWSIYCALERASIEVTGGFHHRRPALELVRQNVDGRTKGRDYKHRLMDYNNDSSTHLDDVRSLFAEALSRVK